MKIYSITGVLLLENDLETLRGADLSGAKADSATRLPTGWVLIDSGLIVRS